MNVIEELKKGKFNALNNLNDSAKINTIRLLKNNKDKDEILSIILPKFYKDAWKYNISLEIFDLIYLDSKYKEYTFYLLHKGYVNVETLNSDQVGNILNKTSWGFDFVYDNIETLIIGINGYKNKEVILNYCQNNREKYKILLDKVLRIDNQELRDEFILSSIIRKIIDDDYILMSLYKNTDDYNYEQISLFKKDNKTVNKSILPIYLLSTKKINEKFSDARLLLIEASRDRKMALINYFIEEEKDSNLLKKYYELLRLYNEKRIGNLDKILSIIIDYKKDKYITKLIKDKEIIGLYTGSTSIPFKVEDKVIKFTLEKHENKKIPKLFLFAPTKKTVIRNEYNRIILTIEEQEFLDKCYHNEIMEKDDVTNWLNELDKQGYVITDPHCLEKDFSNFGFLNDYHDANLGKYHNHEELPEWFKKRPIVLYDIDLLYKKKEKNRKYFITF